LGTSLVGIQTKLTKGLAGWLQFEMQCNHAGVFSERYLTKPIADLLIGSYGTYVIAEVNHELLRNARGRPRQVDFGVLHEGSDQVRIAIETKWIWGKNSFHHGLMLYDMIRLELLAHRYQAETYFILAGMKRDIQRWFDHDRFVQVRNQKRKPFVSPRAKGQTLVIHHHKNSHWRSLLAVAVKPVRDRPLAERFPVSLFGPYPSNAKAADPVVLCWRIWTTQGVRHTFVPDKTRFFKAALEIEKLGKFPQGEIEA